MVLAIFLSFLVCYLPITIVKMVDVNVKYPGKKNKRELQHVQYIYVKIMISIREDDRYRFLDDDKKETKLTGFHVLGYLLLYFASCVNPIIYVIMNKQYRQAYAGVIGCSRIRASLTPFGSSAPGQHHQDFGQGNFEHRRVVTLSKL